MSMAGDLMGSACALIPLFVSPLPSPRTNQVVCHYCPPHCPPPCPCQYKIPTYVTLVATTPFFLDYVDDFQRVNYYKYLVQPLDLMPPLRTAQDVT